MVFGPGIRMSFVFMSTMVFIMVVVISVFNGFEREIHRLLLQSGNHITITRGSSRAPLDNYQEIISSIENTPDLGNRVRRAYGGISVNALLSVGDRFEGKLLRALPVGVGTTMDARFHDFPHIVHYQDDLLKGFSGGPYILVGRRLARHYGWKVGDSVSLLIPAGGRLSRDLQIGQGRFRIAGFIRTGFNEFDLNVIYMSLATAQRSAAFGRAVGEVIVQIRDLSQLDRVVAVVRETIPGNQYMYSFTTIRDEKGTFLAAVRLEKTLMSTVLVLLVLAGAAGIWVTVHLRVNEKRKSIGMLRSMGLSGGGISTVFTLNALLIGLVSAIVGGFCGIFFSENMEAGTKLVEGVINGLCISLYGQCHPFRILPENIYYFDYLPVSADLTVVFGVGVLTMVLSGLAGYFPSRLAASMDPVEAIRSE